MIESCVHTHTTFCDGKNSPAEMAKAAYDLGIKCIGFSGHSYVDIDDFGIKPTLLQGYFDAIAIEKRRYDGKMGVLCGIELDSFSNKVLLDNFDYTIGSAHAVKGHDGKYYIIDGSAESFVEAAQKGFCGSFEELYQAYYEQYSSFILNFKPDIAGHFDLITKFNGANQFFDEKSALYLQSALDALDSVLSKDVVVEVNTGGMNRGYRNMPYPADFLLKRILEKKGRVIITSDAHSVEQLVLNTNSAEKLLKQIGFTEVTELSEKGFYERRL